MFVFGIAHQIYSVHHNSNTAKFAANPHVNGILTGFIRILRALPLLYNSFP
jgi:hypothetical protein